MAEELDDSIMTTEHVESTPSNREDSRLEEKAERITYDGLFKRWFYKTENLQHMSIQQSSNSSISVSSSIQSYYEIEGEHAIHIHSKPRAKTATNNPV